MWTLKRRASPSLAPESHNELNRFGVTPLRWMSQPYPPSSRSCFPSGSASSSASGLGRSFR